MIPGSKGHNTHELAQMWVNDLMTRQNMSIKVGHKHHDMRIFCGIYASNEPKSVLARDLGDYCDNLRNSHSVFLIVVGVRSTEQSVGIMGQNTF